MANWSDYQERAAEFFRSLGLDAQTNARIEGIRTVHDIDVAVRSHHVGFDVLWLVECKYWNRRVDKLHVLALREIVRDVGADRGLLIAESGFQSGALEAAHLTNIQPTSLAELRVTARRDIGRMKTRELLDRTDRCGDRYWAISKEDRIDLGLRPDVGQGEDYSTHVVLSAAKSALSNALRENFPLNPDVLVAARFPSLSFSATTVDEVLAQIEPAIADLERRLDVAEAELAAT